MNIKGLLVPALTFFNKDGSLAKDFIRWHLNWQLSNGVNGLFVTGTYGSGYLMKPEERARVYSIAKEVSATHAGSFVIAHVGTNDTDSSAYLTSEAKKLGIDAVAAVNPCTFKYTDDELVSYYRSLTDAADGMPVFAYNNPSLTSKPIDIELIKKLVSVGVCGIKDSTSNVEYAEKILSEIPNFQYIAGSTKNWAKMRKLGIDTLISGMCNYIPELISSMYTASMNDDEELFYALFNMLEDVGDTVKKGNSVVSSQLALKSRGYNVPYMKRPLFADYDNNASRMSEMSEIISETDKKIKDLISDFRFVE